MSFAVIFFGMLEVIALVAALLVFTVENERLPGRYRSWTPYLTGKGDSYTQKAEIRVGVRRKGSYVGLITLDPSAPDFDDRLAAAQSAARERCVLLNATARSMARQLPS